MKTNYNFNQTQTVKTNFEAYFGVSFGRFYDGLMSVISKRLVIDILKFDDWLHDRHGKYEDKKLSMSDIIFQYYGRDACEFIESLM